MNPTDWQLLIPIFLLAIAAGCFLAVTSEDVNARWSWGGFFIGFGVIVFLLGSMFLYIFKPWEVPEAKPVCPSVEELTELVERAHWVPGTEILRVSRFGTVDIYTSEGELVRLYWNDGRIGWDNSIPCVLDAESK